MKFTLIDDRVLIGRIVQTEGETVHVSHTPEPTKQNKHPQPQEIELQLDQIRKALVQVELNRPHDPELDDEADSEEEN